MLHNSTELQLTYKYMFDLISIAPNWCRIIALFPNNWTCNKIMSLMMGREPTIGHQYSTNQAINGYQWQGNNHGVVSDFNAARITSCKRLDWHGPHVISWDHFCLNFNLGQTFTNLTFILVCTPDLLDIFRHSQQHDASQGHPAKFWAQWQQLARSVHALPRRRLQPWPPTILPHTFGHFPRQTCRSRSVLLVILRSFPAQKLVVKLWRPTVNGKMYSFYMSESLTRTTPAWKHQQLFRGSFSEGIVAYSGITKIYVFVFLATGHEQGQHVQIYV